MRNLKLHKTKLTKLLLENDKEVLDFYVDGNTNKTYILYTDGEASCHDNSIENFHFHPNPIRLTFLSVTSEISIVDETSVNIFDQDLNLVTSFEFSDQCKVAEYSPGQDLLAILSKSGVFQLLTVDSFGNFSVVNEFQIEEQKYVNQFVNVGWGSKETQFHGSEGKDARKNVVSLVEDAVVGVEDSVISWRGDGTLCVVTFKRGIENAFIVLDKDGVPQYSSEVCPGLEAPLSWKPSGNLIAGVQKLPNKYQIVFFEKNGLRHGEFTISSEDTVQKLCWSADSEILCILYTNQKIELWTVNNYHWYLKQTLSFKSSIMNLYWECGFDIRTGKILQILSEDQILSYEWIWNTNYSMGLDQNDQACVGVIDGTKALITPFRISTIPPPMCVHTLQHARPINFILFGPPESPNDVTIVLDNYECYQYKYGYELETTFQLMETDVPLSGYQLLWVKSNLYVSYREKSIVKHAILEGKVTNVVIDVGDVVTNVELVALNNQVLIQLISGETWLLNFDDNSLQPSYKTNFTTDTLKACHISNNLTLFSLDRFNRFYINDKCVSNNITSFFIHSNFLLLTTTQHYLICPKLTAEGLAALENNSPNLFTRRIERGSKLVVATQSDKKVILQLPRGNLETINPRALSIKIIVDLIKAKKYLKAFQIMKVERINLNLLFDHNPDEFLEDVELFVREINDPVLLNLFLLELTDENITQTMYANCYEKRNPAMEGKKSIIADRFIKILEKDNRLLLSLVTAYYIKRTQVDLEKALNVIFETKQTQGFKPAESALSHLLLLVPINEIYNIALGMYNFDLIMFVAEKSQKDPKEYIPFLKELKSLDPNYQKFTIDNHLKRYDKALISLAKCDKFNQCLSFIQTHKLYKKAILLFNKSSEEYKKVCHAFGEFLLEKRCYQEAGIMFERSEDLQRALFVYKMDFKWRNCLIVGAKLKYGSTEFSGLCRDLVQDLIGQSLFKDASVILIEHLSDFEQAVEVLCSGKCWVDAVRLAYVQNRLDLIETHIKPGTLQHAEILQTQITNNEALFAKQSDRLKIIRENKKQKQEFPEDAVNNAVDCDLYSDAGSVISKSTNASTTSNSSFKSFRSSKNRRKHERKLLSTKEGSKFEDVALIRSLHQLYTNTIALRDEIHSLSTTLLSFDEDDLAKMLQTSLETLLKHMKTLSTQIWIESDNEGITFGPDMTANQVSQVMQGDGLEEQRKNSLEPQFRYAPDCNTVHWKLFTLD